MWQLLTTAVESVATPGRPATVLDCGGGSGSFAVPLAQGGAHVTVVDISVDALATLRRRADDAGVGANVNAVQGDVEALADAIGAGTFDLVLAHDILGAVDDAAGTLAEFTRRVRPGGQLSVLVANPVAAVIARAMSGELSAALSELRALIAAPGRFGPDAVRTQCARARAHRRGGTRHRRLRRPSTRPGAGRARRQGGAGRPRGRQRAVRPVP